MDQVIKMKQIPKAGAIAMGEVKISPGGKGNNQAVACSRAGGETTFIGVVGDNFGYDKKLKKCLEENNIKPILQIRKNEDCHIANIIIDDEGMGKILVKSGTDVHLNENIIDQNIEIIENSYIIIFDLEIPLKTVAYAIDKCYEKNKIIILRPSFIFSEEKQELTNEEKILFDNIIKKVNYIIVDESELQIISGLPTSSDQEVINACKEFMRKEPQNLIVISKYNGCSVWNKDEENKKYRSYYNEKEIADFTGAVDCFIGVFAAYLSNNYIFDEAIKYANLAVSISVRVLGIIDTFPKLEEINREREKIKDW
jgi:ribokinase